MNKHKDKSILGILLTALVLCTLMVLGAMPTPASATENVWTEMTSPTEEGLFEVWSSAADDVFVLTTWGGIWHYNGSNWTDMSSSLIPFPCSIWGSAADDVFVVGDDRDHHAIILHYNGTSWSKMETDMAIPPGSRWWLYNVWGSAANDVFAVGAILTEGHHHAIILHYNGTSWSKMDIPPETLPSSRFQYVWGSAANDVFAFGDTYDVNPEEGEYVILHYDGSNWTPIPLPDEFNTPEFCELFHGWGSSNNVYLVGDIINEDELSVEGIVIHYNGESWSEAYRLTSTAFYEVWGASSNDVFVGGVVVDEEWNIENIIIVHYDGSNWTQMDTPTIKDVIYSIWGSSANDVFAVGYEGGIILHYGPAAPPEYILNVTVDPAGSGTVELDPSGGTYPAGTTVTLTAYAAAGYTFDHWSGDLSGNANPATITMDADKNVTAHFVAAGPQPDVNNDGQVNVLDMVLIGQKWGQTGDPGWIKEDVNQDGKIDVLDLILVGQQWTG